MQVQLWRHYARFAFMPNCRSVKEVKVVLLDFLLVMTAVVDYVGLLSFGKTDNYFVNAVYSVTIKRDCTVRGSL